MASKPTHPVPTTLPNGSTFVVMRSTPAVGEHDNSFAARWAREPLPGQLVTLRHASAPDVDVIVEFDGGANVVGFAVTARLDDAAPWFGHSQPRRLAVPGGLTVQRLRRINFAAIERDAREQLRRLLAADVADAELVVEFEFSDGSRRRQPLRVGGGVGGALAVAAEQRLNRVSPNRNRRRLADVELAEFALRYDDVVRRTGQYRAALADHYNMSADTVSDWRKAAQSRGFLTASVGGRHSGRADLTVTDKARRVVDESRLGGAPQSAAE